MVETKYLPSTPPLQLSFHIFFDTGRQTIDVRWTKNFAGRHIVLRNNEVCILYHRTCNCCHLQHQSRRGKLHPTGSQS